MPPVAIKRLQKPMPFVTVTDYEANWHFAHTARMDRNKNENSVSCERWKEGKAALLPDVMRVSACKSSSRTTEKAINDGDSFIATPVTDVR